MMEQEPETKIKKPKKPAGQVSLGQMLKALDKGVAAGVQKKLKLVSRKKAIKVPLDKNKAEQLERKAAYSSVTDDVSKWEPLVIKNRHATQLKFPLDQQPDVLPTTAESVSDLKPMNDLEREVHGVLQTSETALHDNQEMSKAEEKYLKAISVEEAQERHRELQRMRVLLSSYAAKMKRQKAIKSKSYRRLLKHEKIKNHIKRVESDKDLLLDEIERLQRIRAKERASLKHKNTGKWAKHTKFRAKYDEEARKAMMEQIGLAEKFLEKPADFSSSDSDDQDDVMQSDSDPETSDEEGDGEEGNASDNETDPESSNKADKMKPDAVASINDRLIISNELIEKRMKKKLEDGDQMDDSDEEDEQRKLMSEAFADDDVVAEFQEAKDKVADEEQPKDVDTFLPGWGTWTGPGIKVNEKKRKKYIIKAKKIDRKDANLGNVIISEQADNKVKEKQMQKLPRGIRDDNHLSKILSRPTVSTFTTQSAHRDSVRPRIVTKMGARIEPINKRMLDGGKRTKWT